MRHDSCFDTIWEQLYDGQRKWVSHIEEYIKTLCLRFELEPPYFFSLGWDANETGPDMIRLAVPVDSLNFPNADDTARHVFAHWLCNMEGTKDGDKVADIIAGLLKETGK